MQTASHCIGCDAERLNKRWGHQSSHLLRSQPSPPWAASTLKGKENFPKLKSSWRRSVLFSSPNYSLHNSGVVLPWKSISFLEQGAYCADQSQVHFMLRFCFTSSAGSNERFGGSYGLISVWLWGCDRFQCELLGILHFQKLDYLIRSSWILGAEV